VSPLPSPADAEALIRQHVRPLPVESRPLAALAGAVLVQEVRAERDQPPFHRVTMDGIAIASHDWTQGQRRFRIAGTEAAGQRPLPLPPGECLEVMTGAVLPPGSDCVIPVERLEVADGWLAWTRRSRSSRWATSTPAASTAVRASDCSRPARASDRPSSR